MSSATHTSRCPHHIHIHAYIHAHIVHHVYVHVRDTGHSIRKKEKITFFFRWFGRLVGFNTKNPPPQKNFFLAKLVDVNVHRILHIYIYIYIYLFIPSNRIGTVVSISVLLRISSPSLTLEKVICRPWMGKG